jgi:hypothetical protein
MLNKAFYDWLVSASKYAPFISTTSQTEVALDAQAGVELVLRFIAFRNVRYKSGLDVHEYLDKALAKLAVDSDFDCAAENRVFEKTFSVLNAALSTDAFKRWDGRDFKGKFLMSVYEIMATGTSKNIEAIEGMNDNARNEFLTSKAKALWENEVFRANSGAGVRGTTRLANLLPMAEEFLRPS